MADLAKREGARELFVPALSQPIRPGHDLWALASLVRIVRRFRPHIVHTHTAKAGFLGRQAALLGLRQRPAIVHTYHGHVLEGYFGAVKQNLYRGLERRLAHSSDRLIGVSQTTVDDLVRLGIGPRERFRVIPLGLDLSRYDSVSGEARLVLRRQLGLEDSDVLVAFVGRVVPIKRLDVLIRAVGLADDARGTLHLAVVGDGESRDELERLAMSLRIRSQVHFLGYRRDLPCVFAASDIAGLSSDNEGTPVSLIEAGAAGLPAVATQVGGVGEVVTPASGLLVPRGDAEALAKALNRLASDPAGRARMGAVAREHVRGRFALDRLMADMTELYTELNAVP